MTTTPDTTPAPTPRPTRPEHTVACTDALILRAVGEARTARDLRIVSSALREAAEQRDDLGLPRADVYYAAYVIAQRAPTAPAGRRRTVAGIVALLTVGTVRCRNCRHHGAPSTTRTDTDHCAGCGSANVDPA